jgi:hypothetical protein
MQGFASVRQEPAIIPEWLLRPETKKKRVVS